MSSSDEEKEVHYLLYGHGGGHDHDDGDREGEGEGEGEGLARQHHYKSRMELPQLTPLPDERYPRIIEERVPDRGYYIALGLVMSVWMITPLSCAYVAWYALGRLIPGRPTLTSTIFAAYAMTEILFSIYMSYLIRHVQSPSPPSSLPLEERNALFHRVLHAGLDYPLPPKLAYTPTTPATPASPSSTSDDEEDRGGRKLDAHAKRAETDFRAGLISAAQLYHEKDRVYEESIGMRERRRVGRMTEQERGVIEAFVEETPGDREKRLREQIEGDLKPWDKDDKGWGHEGITDEEGEVRGLHPWDRRAIEFRERLRTWFNHAPWKSIKRENIAAWLAWSCFGTTLPAVRSDADHAAFLEETIKLLEARTGWDFEPGFNDKVQVMRLTLDPVNAKGRPLILYAVSNLVNLWLRAMVYPYQGMGLYKEGDIQYLIRIPQGWTPEEGKKTPNAMPVVYLHGLGFGLLQSHLLIKHLLKSLPTHPILIPISPHTSQALFNPRHLRPATRTEMVDAIKTICTQWGFFDEFAKEEEDRGGVSLLSHSNGSVAHGWLLKDCPSIARRSTFVDPVVFCLWEGDVCHSFCYRRPTTALELLLYYFIASELGIAHYISRHFDWASNTLFFDEIPHATDPSKTAFFLGGKDIIIDSARVRRYLERHGVGAGLHWDAGGGHGDGLAGTARDRVVMFAGTGSTRGWQGWLRGGRRRHSLGQDDRNGNNARTSARGR